MAKEPKIVPFGKYELLEKIAVGGMAEIFKARTKGVGGFEKYLAIKRILPHLSENKDFIDMLINEAKIAVMLSHANIVQIYDLGKIDDSYFIAMEYIEGKDLRALMTRCDQIGMPLFIQHAIFISIEVCKGLEYAHAKTAQEASGPKELNIVHRDISPQNVMISYEGEVKITDFGIAKANVNISETEAGVVKGKYEYMSPEQASGLPVDRRTDIFSTGIVLYEMLTGQKPFRGESDLTILERVREAKVEPPSKYNKSIPKKLEKIVLKSLARDTADRYLTATELKDDLTRFFYSSTFNFTTSNLAAFMKSIFAEEIKLDVLSDSTGIGKRPELETDGRTISRIFGRPDSDRFGKGKEKNGTSAGAPLGAITNESTNVGASRSETSQIPENRDGPTSSRTLGGEQLESIEDEINRILIPGKTNAGKLPVAPANESSGSAATAQVAAISEERLLAGDTGDSRTSPIPVDETGSKATVATPRPITASMLLGGDAAALELGMEIDMAMPALKSQANARPKPAEDEEEEPPTEAGRGAGGGGWDEPLPESSITGRAKRLNEVDRPTMERIERPARSREESTDGFARENENGNANGNGRKEARANDTDNFDRPTRSSMSGRGARVEPTEPDDEEGRSSDADAPARQRESTIISDKPTGSGRSSSVSIKAEPDDSRTDAPRSTGTGSAARAAAPASASSSGTKVPIRAVKEKVRGVTVNAPDASPSSRTGRGEDEHQETIASPAKANGTNGGTSGGTRGGAESTLIGQRPASPPADERSSTGRTSREPSSARAERNTPPAGNRRPDRDTRPATGPNVTRLGPTGEDSGTASGADRLSRDYEMPAPRNNRTPQPSRTSVVSSSQVDDQADLYPDVADGKRSATSPLLLIAGLALVFLAGVLIAKFIPI